MELFMKTPAEACHSCLAQFTVVAVRTMINNIVMFWCPRVFCIDGESYLLGIRTSNLSSSQDIITLKVEQHFKNFMAIVPSPYDSKATGEITIKQYYERYKKADDKLKELVQEFSASLPSGHREVDSPETRKVQVFP